MAVPEEVVADPHRYRLARAGVLNVWQYDEQVFELADGRMLLRGANGAGKSKTLEMLLPFVLDGDKRRLSAAGGQYHTSLACCG
jgi:ABC-type Na+ transport system ATPase subunit NatA